MSSRNPEDDGDGNDECKKNTNDNTGDHDDNDLWHAKAGLGGVGGRGAAIIDWVVRVRQLKKSEC